MTREIRFHETAEFELNDAAVFFESKTTGLGIRFLSAVERAVAEIVEHPQASPIVLQQAETCEKVSVQHHVHHQTRPHPRPRDREPKAPPVLLARSQIKIEIVTCNHCHARRSD